MQGTVNKRGKKTEGREGEGMEEGMAGTERRTVTTAVERVTLQENATRLEMMIINPHFIYHRELGVGIIKFENLS